VPRLDGALERIQRWDERNCVRLLRVALHLAAGCAISAVVYPLASRPARRALQQRWSKDLLAILGVRLRAPARPLAPASLVVANHVSWLDAIALNALGPAAFVCKSEVRRWPVLGWLIERQETYFVARGNARDARRLIGAIRRRLSAGERVALFPEGTTSDGTGVLAFRPALIEAATQCGALVQPVALSYSGPEAAFIGEMTFWRSLRAVAAASGLEIRAQACVPLSTSCRTRREVAAAARRAIQARLAGGESPSGMRPGATADRWAVAA
jgi:1-acyl-sn-glycerol-3-phosphate acyltransferase